MKSQLWILAILLIIQSAVAVNLGVTQNAKIHQSLYFEQPPKKIWRLFL
jgi:hypothetical protein